MLERTWMRSSNSRSDNLKSKHVLPSINSGPEPVEGSHAEGSKIQNGWGFSPSFLLSSCVGQWFTPRKISSKASRSELSAAGSRAIFTISGPGTLRPIWENIFPAIPSTTVQNMPGAGSVIAANYVYNVAKPDGLTLGSINPGIYMDQLIGRKEVQYDWAKFNWLGTPEQTESVVIFSRR